MRMPKVGAFDVFGFPGVDSGQRKITALAFTATLAASALWAEFHDVDRFPSQGVTRPRLDMTLGTLCFRISTRVYLPVCGVIHDQLWMLNHGCAVSH